MHYAVIRIADNAILFINGRDGPRHDGVTLDKAVARYAAGTVCGQGETTEDALDDGLNQAAEARINQRIEKELTNA